MSPTAEPAAKGGGPPASEPAAKEGRSAEPRDASGRERCSCCSQDDFFQLYDVFCAIDCRGTGFAIRGDFFKALGEHGAGLQFQRAVRRAALHAHFHVTARDLTLQEYLLRALPLATPEDRQRMACWAAHRRAYRAIMQPGFDGSEDAFHAAFEPLAEGDGDVPLEQLVRSRLLDRHELRDALPAGWKDRAALSLEECVEHLRLPLLSRFFSRQERLALGDRTAAEGAVDDAADEDGRPRLTAAAPETPRGVPSPARRRLRRQGAELRMRFAGVATPGDTGRRWVSETPRGRSESAEAAELPLLPPAPSAPSSPAKVPGTSHVHRRHAPAASARQAWAPRAQPLSR